MADEFGDIATRFWDNVESLRVYAQMMLPVARKGVAETLGQFLTSVLELRHSANPEDEAMAVAAAAFIKSMSQTLNDSTDPASDSSAIEAQSDSDAVNTESRREKVAFSFDETRLNGAQLAALRKVNLMFRSGELLHRSALVTLVSFFEVLVADLCHGYYRLHPEALSGDDKILSLNDLKRFQSIEEASETIVRDRVENLLRGSMEDWRQFFLKQLKIDLGKLVPGKWDVWAEMFQRRNLLVHNDGKVNHIYLSKIGTDYVRTLKSPPAMGDELEVTAEYLEDALNCFAVVGLRLVDLCWGKLQAAQRRDRDEYLYDVVQQCLTEGRMAIVEMLSAHAAQRECYSESLKLNFKISYWIAVKRQERWAEIAADVAAFDTSACNPRFAVSVHCLREDVDAFFRDLPLAVRSGLSEQDLYGGILFEQMREKEQFRREASKLFHVPNYDKLKPLLLRPFDDDFKTKDD